jgi:hypothetical protein
MPVLRLDWLKCNVPQDPANPVARDEVYLTFEADGGTPSITAALFLT